MSFRSAIIKNIVVASLGLFSLCAPAFRSTPVEFEWRGTLWSAAFTGGSFRIDDLPQIKLDTPSALMVIDRISAVCWKQIEEAGLGDGRPSLTTYTPAEREEFGRICSLAEAIHGNRGAIDNLAAAGLVNLNYTLVTMIVSIACLVRLLFAAHRLRASRRAEAFGLCPVCRYDLRATPDRCPECGFVPTHAAPRRTEFG